MNSWIVNPEISLLQDAKGEATEASPLLMDEEAFRAFYERTSRSLWLYLARITGDRQVADDLMQETYYRFFRAGAAHESESHRRHSLFRIATNLASDAYRRRGGIVSTTLDDVSAWTVDHGMEERTDLVRAMEHLRPQQREMLWLAYANGSSHEEIAEVVGVAPGSVKALLRRARMKLAKLLGGTLDEAGRPRR